VPVVIQKIPLQSLSPSPFYQIFGFSGLASLRSASAMRISVPIHAFTKTFLPELPIVSTKTLIGDFRRSTHSGARWELELFIMYVLIETLVENGIDMLS
jgi:hypothetical protein